MSAYVLGHSDHERRRLALQATMLAPHTMRFLVDAGISAEMRVLDLGCGVGDVSLLAGHLVESGGSVVGLDVDQASIEVASARAAQHGLKTLQFHVADIAQYENAEPFDAVIGRLILQHMADPVEILRQAARRVKPGGIVAFQDCSPGFNVITWPESPKLDAAMTLLAKFAAAAIPQPFAGTRLYHWFAEAGLKDLRVEARVLTEGGPESVYYEWLAETIRSLLPRAILTGLVQPGEYDPDTLAAEIREEAMATGTPVNAALLTGVCARAI